MLDLQTFILFLVLFNVVFTNNYEEVELSIYSNCQYEIYNPNEYLTYVIRWNGESPGSMQCKLGFRGDGGDGSGYITCVEANRFYIQGPGISVKFQSETFSTPDREKVYRHNESPSTKFCTDINQYLSVIVDANERGFGAAPVDTSRSYFTLRVTADPTNKSGLGDGPSTMTIVLIIIAIIGSIGFCICCYKCRAESKTAQPNHGVGDDDNDEEDDGTRESGRRVGPVHPGYTVGIQEPRTIPSAPDPHQLGNDHQRVGTSTMEGYGMNQPLNSQTTYGFDYPTTVNGSQTETSCPTDIEMDIINSGHNKPSSLPNMPPPSYAEVMNNR